MSLVEKADILSGSLLMRPLHSGNPANERVSLLILLFHFQWDLISRGPTRCQRFPVIDPVKDNAQLFTT